MIFHIGYYKTGTTFLQHNVFPNMEGLKFYAYRESYKMLKDVFSETSLSFDVSKTLAKLDTTAKALYSLENLVGEMGVGTYDYEIGDRLKLIGAKKIIVTIRRQDSMIESTYRQYVQQGGVQTSEDFISTEKYFKWSHFDFHPLVLHYINLFGKENVLLICQEEMKESLNNVFNKLSLFCGSEKISISNTIIQPNLSLSYSLIRFLRILNHFTYNFYRPSNLISNKITTSKIGYILQYVLSPLLHSSLKKKVFYGEKIRKEILIKYSESNRLLEREFSIKLNEYNYFIKN